MTKDMTRARRIQRTARLTARELIVAKRIRWINPTPPAHLFHKRKAAGCSCRKSKRGQPHRCVGICYLGLPKKSLMDRRDRSWRDEE